MQILHASTFRQVRLVVFDYLKLCTEFTRLLGMKEVSFLMRTPDALQRLPPGTRLPRAGGLGSALRA